MRPKSVLAFIWLSVLDSEPMSKDSQMYHQALRVIAQTKLAANGWIHMNHYNTFQRKHIRKICAFFEN